MEVIRAVRSQGEAAVERARQALQGVVLVGIDDELLETAASLDAAIQRSLDAIHVATALRLGSDLTLIVTYDDRMRAAAQAVGLRSEAPG